VTHAINVDRSAMQGSAHELCCSTGALAILNWCNSVAVQGCVLYVPLAEKCKMLGVRVQHNAVCPKSHFAKDTFLLGTSSDVAGSVAGISLFVKASLGGAGIGL